MKSSKKLKIGLACYSILSLPLIIKLWRHTPPCTKALGVNGAVLLKQVANVHLGVLLLVFVCN